MSIRLLTGSPVRQDHCTGHDRQNRRTPRSFHRRIGVTCVLAAVLVFNTPSTFAGTAIMAIPRPLERLRER